MKTARTFAAAAVGPVLDRTPSAPSIPCDSSSVRPGADRPYGFTGEGSSLGQRLQLPGADACGSEVRQNFDAGYRTESLGGFRYNGSRQLRLHGALLGLLAAALLAGCGSRPDSAAHADPAGHGAELPPAVVFKAGRGLQLSAAAAQHIGLATAEVATRDLPGAPGVAAVPDSALLRTVRGDFVFVANGGWLLRTPVTVGPAGSGWLEVKDGLYEGDTVVEQGTRALWLAEIQAVNGGVSCTHGH